MKSLSFVVRIAVTALIIGVLLPALPGVTFTGGVGTAVLAAILTNILTFVLFIPPMIVILILGVIALFKNGGANPIAALRKIGYSRIIVGFFALSIFVDTFGLKIAAWWTPGFTIHGLTPAILGAFAMVASSLPSLFIHRKELGSKKFNDALDKAAAEQARKEAEKHATVSWADQPADSSSLDLTKPAETTTPLLTDGEHTGEAPASTPAPGTETATPPVEPAATEPAEPAHPAEATEPKHDAETPKPAANETESGSTK